MFLAVAPISIGDALLLSLVGFAIVFFVLCVLMAMIALMTAAANRFQNTEAPPSPVDAVIVREEASRAAAAVPLGKVPAEGSVGECLLHTVSDQTAAILMAIVADDLKIPLNELRFISIKEL
jgi:Na+-transporting methylmalonyl-CoA/oxaloacetate decarboxylase gamma subunit